MIYLRDIQQFYYCPKRWGLMKIDKEWDENYFVIKGEFVHERVNDGRIVTFSDGKIIEHSLPVYLKDPELYGIIDSVELVPDQNGRFLEKYHGCYKMVIVEYKASKTKRENQQIADMLQLYGQKLCIDNMFTTEAGCNFYYADVRRKEKVFFNEEVKRLFYDIINQMQFYMRENIIPPKREEQYCGGCSMENLCLPKTFKLKKSFADIAKECNAETT